MHQTLPLLMNSSFPALTRDRLSILQVNLGYFCNQSCLHCHVNAGPKRKEMMSEETAEQVIAFLQASNVDTLDLTGGAPELHSVFKTLVRAGRAKGCRVIDRCNLTVLFEPGQEGLATYLRDNEVDIVASLPCYIEDNVDMQRGDGVYQKSIRALKLLNSLGYGQENSGLRLELVYNPQGPVLPPSQQALERDYKAFLADEHGIEFNSLFALANLPIKRFGSTLISRGQFHSYMELLRSSHRPENLDNVMCRHTLSVNYQGYIFDCDFNQMLNMPAGDAASPKHISSVMERELYGAPIVTAEHCYGCTAGQGSSCGGAL